MISFEKIKKIVDHEFYRLGAFNPNNFFQLIELNQTKKLHWFKINNPNSKEEQSGYIVPAGIDEETIQKAMICRYHGRFPTLAFINKKNGNCIWRSSELKLKMMNHES